MKFLHTSDWHLGASDGNRSLVDDQKFFIDDICRIIEENVVEAVLIAGDVYDRSVSSAEAIKLFDYAMSRFCLEKKLPVLIIAGNHDSAERLSTCRELLSGAGLHIVGDLGSEPVIVPLGDTDFYFLPWITEEKVKARFPDRKDSIRSLEDAYRVVTDSMRATFTEGRRHVLLSHSYIADSVTSTSDRAAVIGHAAQVSAEVFNGFDYVALGHLHGPQDINSFIRYSGTPMPYSYGAEEEQVKSVTIVDTADMSRTTCELGLLHGRATLTGTLAELLSDETPEELRNAYVNINITDEHVNSFILSQLFELYPYMTDCHGKTFEDVEGGTQMSIEEFEALENDPAAIFRRYCSEVMGMQDIGENLVALFTGAVEEVGR